VTTPTAPATPLALLALAALVGCTDLQADPCDFYICDIDDAGCVDDIATALACQRDTDPVVPFVRTLTREEALEDLQDAPLPDDEAQRLRDYYRAESLMGLMPQDYDPEGITSDFLENVVAYYRRDTVEITLIEDSAIEDPATRYEILVHEMVHASQDAQWDLEFQDVKNARTTDRWLALRAVIEGDAELYRALASVRLAGYHPDQIQWEEAMRDAKEQAKRRAFESVAPSIDALADFAYAFGLSFIRRAWTMGGFPYIESTILNPPDAVREIMRVEEAGPFDTSNEDAALNPEAVPILEGFTYLGGDFQGTWLINAMLQRTANTTYGYEDALHGVTADYLSGWRHDETGELAAVWRVRSNTPLAGVLLAYDGSWRSEDEWYDPGSAPKFLLHRVGGDEVLIASSSDAQLVLDALRGWQAPQTARAAAGIDGADRRTADLSPHVACAMGAPEGVVR
jgi:hypothetical protein